MADAADIVSRLEALKREPVAHLREPEHLEWLLAALGRAENGRQLEDVRYLIESALEGRDGLSILRTELATRYLALGLGSPRPLARQLACEQLTRLATAGDVRTLVESGALDALPALIADDELAVANAAGACLLAAAASCEAAELDQGVILSPRLLHLLHELAIRPGAQCAAVRLRACELCCKLALLSPRAFNACNSAGILHKTVDLWLASTDVLEKLAALELLLDLAAAPSSPAGLALVAGEATSAQLPGAADAAVPPQPAQQPSALSDVLQTLEQCIEQRHPDPLATALLAAPILSFVARLAASGPAQHGALLARGALPLCARALAAATSDEVAVGALNALRALGASHGARSLGVLLGETDVLERVCALIEGGRAPRAVRAAAVSTLGALLGAAATAGGECAHECAALEAAAQRALSREDTTLVRALLAGATGAEEAMRAACLDFLHALCLSSTGALLVACSDQAIGYLTDTTEFRAAADVPRKRDIATALLRQPAASAQLAPSARNALAAAGGAPLLTAASGQHRAPALRDAAAAVAGDADMG